MRYSLALLLLFGLAWATPAAAQGQALDLASYERLLREARAAAVRGDRLDVVQVAPALTTATHIRMPDGGSARVDNSWLAAELRKPAPDLPLVAARLGALIDALTTRAPPAPPDATSRLEDILAHPPFDQPAAAPREPGPFERFIQWLFERLAELFQPVAQAVAGTPGSAASWLLTAMGAALVVAVLVIWLRGLRRTLRAEAQGTAPRRRG